MNVALYMKQHKSAVFSLLVLTILLSLKGTYAFAADLDTNIISGSSSQFNQYIGDWFTSMQSAARAISTIMVVLGGINIALNLESANKTVWSICLGAGLALNIGSVLTQAWTPVASLDPSAIDFHIDIPSGNEFSVDSIMKFPEVYRKYTVAGANYMMGPATKLLLVLTAIGAMIKLSLDLVSGDKVRYFTELMLETGVYFFLITNW
ncbi:MAG: conjugal transfer protein TrbL, partial [Selenomonas sp.]|nr:conjugal transfer protein TrbL [Selenomonas sp.]